MRLTIEQREAYNRYIIDCIDGDAYDVELKTDNEKLEFLYDTFKSEYGFNIDRIGLYPAFTEWIQGLPSVFNIEFENYKILELAKRLKSLSDSPTEKEEDKLLDNYWNFITNKTMLLIKKATG